MLSFLFFMLTVGIGMFGIVQAIDFCGHLRQYDRKQYEMLTFERPFGMAREDFLLHPIKPHKFIPYFFTNSEEDDQTAKMYKLRLRVILGVFVVLGITLFFIP